MPEAIHKEFLPGLVCKNAKSSQQLLFVWDSDNGAKEEDREHAYQANVHSPASLRQDECFCKRQAQA